MELKKALKILGIVGLVAVLLLNTGCIRIMKFAMPARFPVGTTSNIKLSLAANVMDIGTTGRFVVWVLPPDTGYTIGPVTYTSTGNRYGSGTMTTDAAAVTWLNTDADTNGQSDNCVDPSYTPSLGANVNPNWQAFRTGVMTFGGPKVKLHLIIPVTPPGGATTGAQVLKIIAGEYIAGHMCQSGLATIIEVQ